LSDDDQIPIIETYRRVGVHDGQPAERIESIVKPAIDVVHSMADPLALFSYALDAANPPEARIFAAAKCEAIWELAAESRVARPKVDLKKLRAGVTALDSLEWRDPTTYQSLLASSPRAAKREPPLGS
jgi:hypothetical protein